MQPEVAAMQAAKISVNCSRAMSRGNSTSPPPGNLSVVRTGDFVVTSGMNFGGVDSDESARVRFY